MKKKYSKEEINDYSKRIQSLMSNLDLSIGIGGLSRTCNVPQSKIRYWEQKGYIGCHKGDKNTNHRYPYSAVIKVELIKSFLDSGYTLAKAAEKASVFDETGSLLHRIARQRFESINVVDENTAVDMGPIKDDPEHHIMFVDEDGTLTAQIVKKD
ncbi:MAG: MerR family transcriptional regulator [Apilactobacillus sp.]|uniref:MerR family transcriptional regulator n=1 Tax=Apilactobacillus TaxID=2767877 RepID=UPI0025E3AC24|nr:MerR family transcriptional regulator [Apilactobacillus sp.]MCT6823179.1 MerR family transcriptional regulator [Apilactobacillus sp.]MCT6857922.1 MerR family transcriptional regulator [Apilactobacillus sp.]